MPIDANLQGEYVPINILKPDPDNARVHSGLNIQTIRKSLKEFGQREPLHVRKSDNVVLGGNARLQVMRSLSYKKVWVVYHDLNIAQSKALALMLNRAGELATWDETKLAETLSYLQTQEVDIETAGFRQDELDALMKEAVKDAPAESVAADSAASVEMENVAQLPDAPKPLQPNDDNNESEESSESAPPDPKMADDYVGELPTNAIGGNDSPFTLSADVVFKSRNVFGIPDLRPDMLGDLPESLTTWAGEYSVPATHYLAIWKSRSFNGLPYDKSVLGFYTYDGKFEDTWFDILETAKLILSQKWHAVIAPQFSAQEHFPHIVNMYQVYRKMHVARFWQEIGIKVIPDIGWLAVDEHLALGIPKKVPCVSLEMQGRGDYTTEQLIEFYTQILERNAKKISFDRILLYYSHEDVLAGVLKKMPKSITPMNVLCINNILRDKLAKPTKKDRKKVLEKPSSKTFAEAGAKKG